MDPNASNYNSDASSEDGSCIYIAPSGEKVGSGPDMHKYVATLRERVMHGDPTAGLERALGTEGAPACVAASSLLSMRSGVCPCVAR